MKTRWQDVNADSGEKTWLTPRHVIDALGHFDTDPCCPPEMPWRTADRMLAEGTLTLSQIAKKLGYFDYSHFYKAYRSVYGHAPVRTGDGVTDAANTLPSDADDGI